jgi:hypothetical protein
MNGYNAAPEDLLPESTAQKPRLAPWQVSRSQSLQYLNHCASNKSNSTNFKWRLMALGLFEILGKIVTLLKNLRENTSIYKIRLFKAGYKCRPDPICGWQYLRSPAGTEKSLIQMQVSSTISSKMRTYSQDERTGNEKKINNIAKFNFNFLLQI